MFDRDALKYGLGIRRRITTFFLAIVFVSFFPILLLDRYWLSSFYERSERTFLTQTQKSLQALLAVRQAHLEHLIWQYAEHPRLLGLFVDIVPGDPYLDIAFVLDFEGQLLQAEGQKGAFLEKDGTFNRRLFKIISQSGLRSGFWVNTDKRLFFLASARIAGGEGAGSPPEILVFAISVDEQFLKEASSQLNASITYFNSFILQDLARLRNVSAEDKTSLEASHKELVYSQNAFLVKKMRKAGGREAYYLDFLLRDITGDDIGLVRIVNPNPTAQRGEGFFFLLISAIILVALVCVLIMSHFLTLHITAPLVRLREAIQDIASTRSLSRRLKVQSEDEVGGLIFEFNNMLEEIEQMNLKLKRANDEALILYKDLLEQKKFASEVLSSAPTLVLVLLPDGRIKFANEAFETMLGYKPEEAIGRNWLEEFLPFDNKQEIRAVFNEILKGNVAPYQQKENRVMTKKGSQRTILWSNSVLKDRQGRVTAVISIGQDITEHKLVESELMVKMGEMERFYKVTMDREKVVLQLKGQIKELKERLHALEGGKKG